MVLSIPIKSGGLFAISLTILVFWVIIYSYDIVSSISDWIDKPKKTFIPEDRALDLWWQRLTKDQKEVAKHYYLNAGKK